MGVSPTSDNPKPIGVSDAAWAFRISLPRVRSEGDCNVALLAVLKLDHSYSARVDNFADIVGTESRGGILSNCFRGHGFGGFRQVRTLAFSALSRELAYKTDW